MPILLRYGDALGLLSELKDKFGNRKYNDIEIKQHTTDISIKRFEHRRFKKGDLLFQGWALYDDESEAAYQLRVKEGNTIIKQIEDHGGNATHAIIKRDFFLRSTNREKNAKTVIQMVEEIEAVLSSYTKGGDQFLSPKDIADFVIQFLKNGSEMDEAYLCDKKIESPSDFFYLPQQYYGNEFINDILKRYGLTDDKHQTIDDFSELSKSDQLNLDEAIKRAKVAETQFEQEHSKKGLSGFFRKMF